jgi:hypothetical protein
MSSDIVSKCYRHGPEGSGPVVVSRQGDCLLAHSARLAVVGELAEVTQAERMGADHG